MEDFHNITRNKLPNVQGDALRPIAENEFNPTHSLDWNNRTALLSAKDFKASEAMTLFHKCFDIWFCTGRALDHRLDPLYVEVAYKVKDDDGGTGAFGTFWGAIQARYPDAALDRAITYASKRIPRSCYIPAEVGHVRSRFLSALIGDKQRMKSFLVALHGSRNPILCTHCIENFASHYSQSGCHIQYPFFECVSMGDCFQGSCANCLFKSYGDCEYHFLDYKHKPGEVSSLYTPLLGRESQSDKKLTDEVLSPATAPRFTVQPVFDVYADTAPTHEEIREIGQYLRTQKRN